MTTTPNPITPPAELVREWYNASPNVNEKALQDVATAAAQWGADQELEACCAVLDGLAYEEAISGDQLLKARRPGTSLKARALEAARIELNPDGKNGRLILQALEALPDD